MDLPYGQDTGNHVEWDDQQRVSKPGHGAAQEGEDGCYDTHHHQGSHPGQQECGKGKEEQLGRGLLCRKEEGRRKGSDNSMKGIIG